MKSKKKYLIYFDLIYSDNIKNLIGTNRLIYTFKNEKRSKNLQRLSKSVTIVGRFKRLSSKSKRSIRKSSKVKLNQIKAKLGGNESVDQKIKIKNIILFLTYEKKVLIFFRDYSLLLSEDRANY